MVNGIWDAVVKLGISLLGISEKRVSTRKVWWQDRLLLAAGCCGLVLLCPLGSPGVRMKPPQSTRAAHGAGDIVPASVWAFQHCWSLGNGGSFPTCGEIFLHYNRQPSVKGCGWCEALEGVGNNRGVDEHERVALPSQNTCSVDLISAPVINAGKRCLVHLLCWGWVRQGVVTMRLGTKWGKNKKHNKKTCWM